MTLILEAVIFLRGEINTKNYFGFYYSFFPLMRK